MGKQRRQTRRKQTRRKQSRMRGGAVNCVAEGFTDEMREASAGEDYTHAIVGIHQTGESESFDRLKKRGQDGIIQWWMNKLQSRGQVDYSDADREAIRTSNELNTLSVFYHRFKIVLENVSKAFSYVGKGIGEFIPPFKSHLGRQSFQKVLSLLPERRPPPSRELVTTLATLVSLLQEDFERRIYPIDAIVTKVECLMFTIVKHKGVLPVGFIMDSRIEKWANLPISINEKISERTDMGVGALKYTIEWLTLLRDLDTEFATPVTFGVFE